ncbi:MAG: hypothetical protein ABSG63_04240 [Spirochaetia bacterium]|jgi:hypothetical protein
MSSINTSALFQGVARGVDAAAPLRIMLLPGEALRIPRGRATVRVLSGTAWLTLEGKDIILCTGQCVDCDEQCRSMAIAKEAPVISGLGSQAVLFEVC